MVFPGPPSGPRFDTVPEPMIVPAPRARVLAAWAISVPKSKVMSTPASAAPSGSALSSTSSAPCSLPSCQAAPSASGVTATGEKAEAGDLIFGTTDSWVRWNLTGGVDGGVHVTDVTNASRTMFMDLETLEWRDDILEAFGVPRSMMPEIRSSSEVYGAAEDSSLLRETPIAGILGDQQAATFGQAAFQKGESKNTYGTGCFLIFNTGEEIVHSKNGLLTTVGYKLGDQPTHYALEGSIAVTGSLIQWLRDQLGIISSAPEVEELAEKVEDNGGVYIVPAFSGLFAPYWRPDARGAILGLTRFANKGHIARAALEAVCYQTRDLLEAMRKDWQGDGKETVLRVDGGMVASDWTMQFLADILDAPVDRPTILETTALGAAWLAGMKAGIWPGMDAFAQSWARDVRFEPKMDEAVREEKVRGWDDAVQRTLTR